MKKLSITAGGLVVAAILMAGCGGSSSKSSSSSSSNTTAAPSQALPGQSTSSGGGGAFCDKIRQYETQSNELEALFTGNPTQVKQAVQESTSFMSEFIADAPSSLKSAAQTLDTALNQLYSALAANGYVITKVPQSDLQVFSTPAVQQASTTLTDYLHNTCHIVTTTTTAG